MVLGRHDPEPLEEPDECRPRVGGAGNREERVPVGYVSDIVSVRLYVSLHAANHRKCGEEEGGEDAPLNALLLHLWLDPRGDEREDFCDFLLGVLHLGSRNLYLRSGTE